MISNLHDAIKMLPGSSLAALQRSIFSAGQFYALSGVGAEVNPFPVLGFTRDRLPRTRFSAKSVSCKTFDKDALHALELFGKALDSNREVFIVRRGQLLIVNQLLVAHGRLPLGPQESLKPAERRLVLQLFLRKNW